MPQHHTTGDQVKFVGEWFTSWSELQREDFMPILLRKFKKTNNAEGAPAAEFDALNLNTSNRPPSLFHCQVKLFQDWMSSWSEEERTKLLALFKEIDAAFMVKFNDALDGSCSSNGVQNQAAAELVNGEEVAEGERRQENQAIALPVNGNAPGAQLDSDVDEALESSPSSTVSSPRPSDGHPDSGMDSPVEAVVEEDEGGHVVVIDDVREPVDALPINGAA